MEAVNAMALLERFNHEATVLVTECDLLRHLLDDRIEQLRELRDKVATLNAMLNAENN